MVTMFNEGVPCVRLTAEELSGFSPATWFKRKPLSTYWGHTALLVLVALKHDVPEAFSLWAEANPSKRFKHFCLPDSFFIEDAKRFTSRIAWKQGSNNSYQHVRRHRRHLLEQITAHMPTLAGNYQIYIYEFEDNTAYVGLTCNPERRHYNHMVKGPVAEKVRGGIPHVLKVLHENINSASAIRLEKEEIQKRMQDGFTLLNSHAGGQLGTVALKYTYPLVLGSASNYPTKRAWEDAHPNLYQLAHKRKWMRKIEEACNWPQNALLKWTFEKCMESARPHAYLSDWLKADKQAYAAAHDHGWLSDIRKECFRKFKPWKVSQWTKEACTERAKQFTTRSAWQYEAQDGSYATARRNGWLDDIYQEISLGMQPKGAPRGTKRCEHLPSCYTTERGKPLTIPENFGGVSLVGRVFSLLTVDAFAGVDVHEVYWACTCACGIKKVINGKALKRGLTTSCGCHRAAQV